MLLAEEFFSSENAAFLETLRKVNQPKTLAGFTDRWKKDPRPWARQQILDYLNAPLNRPGHQPVVKRLFKQAEENSDHALMAAFLVAFDRHVRRQIQTQRRWDLRRRAVIEVDRLATPRDVIPLKPDRTARNPATGELVGYESPVPPNGKLFTYRTRYYLRRRAWRYFRRLGHRDPAAYRIAIAHALELYQDADLSRGENILDSWGLMHACFGKHDALEFGATHIRLKDGRTLSELSPAPAFPDAWKASEAGPLLLSLILQSRARLVRLWAIQLYPQAHKESSIPLETLFALLENEDADIQQFAAGLLESSIRLGTLPIQSWLRLLGTKNEEALQIICDAFAKHVSGDRLDLAQCVAIASQRPVPVARLGQRYLAQRAVNTPEERQEVGNLSRAKCPAVAGELTRWALGFLGTTETYEIGLVTRFFDSSLEEIRRAAWEWLVSGSPGLNDPRLWSRLAETPHDDLRLRLIDFLQRNADDSPFKGSDPLEPVWRSVLLGVHRGGRQKAKAVQQISQAILRAPERADALLPVLAVTVRSVRGPESRAGLAAVLTVLESLPQLGEAIRRLIPEMKLEEGPA